MTGTGREPGRTLAVDWSGALDVRTQRRAIRVAEAAEGRLVRVEGGRTRDELVAWLVAEGRRSPGLRVGLDFAFGFPAWQARHLGCADAPAVWRRARDDGERWLRDEPVPFWGRRARRPDLGGRPHLRATDLAVPPVAGIRPKSPFQVGGAGAVGTGTLRGMPCLLALREAGWRLWPFDDVAGDAPAAFEIWPRALSGAVVKSDADGRRAWLAAHATASPLALLDEAAASDDAFDAAVAALALDRHRRELLVMAATRDDDERLEGRIWRPAAEAAP